VVTHRYVDPLAQIWLTAAQRIGLKITRTADAYAATDGKGTLAIATDENLDGDDSLAQMIFHELCHSLVEGEDSFKTPDWGMDNTGPDHDWREHAALRVQWVLSGRHGLRGLFAPTTDFRTSFWNQLSNDALADRGERSVQHAITALRRSDKHPWGPHLAEALAATARVAREIPAASGTLWSEVVAAPALHPTGLPGGVVGSCGACAWRAGAKCRQAEKRVDPTWDGCERYEPALDCQACGACCREAYHSVEVKRRDPCVKLRPEYIVDRGTYLEVKRDGDRCSALKGDKHYLCVIYDDRPRTCRDFTNASEHCLTARRRVGLSL
jgi:hypothetical protein